MINKNSRPCTDLLKLFSIHSYSNLSRFSITNSGNIILHDTTNNHMEKTTPNCSHYNLHLLKLGSTIMKLFVGVMVSQDATASVDFQCLLLVTPVHLQVLFSIAIQPVANNEHNFVLQGQMTVSGLNIHCSVCVYVSCMCVYVCVCVCLSVCLSVHAYMHVWSYALLHAHTPCVYA